MDGLLMISQFVLGVEGLIAHAAEQRHLFHSHPASGLVVLRHDLSFRLLKRFAGIFCQLTQGRTDGAIGYNL
jgi:hypothetical protein